ncbi:Demethylmenaquinone methyltransferase [Streptomyces sp. YIM 130001]|uniref:class I SAM-dependent methyltransferase n=1 Tax=Streptomyces sp. YIM 130001 TaxID=2259644 RepID=UPI000ECCF468|nr:methyltransferase domain-containing protein [Streptomyces sp. YIM 130001]RII13117.1 Demethylmenaquinone methyltransferase [Streptomyces sp. YIM 130001]
MSENERTSQSYVMDSTSEETRRLQLQSAVYRQASEHLLRRAGIVPGMRVLDVGCGPGDVSMLLAELVGPSGSVIGVDLDEHLLGVAKDRAAAAGLGDRIEFRQDDITALALDGQVDAVVGRIILLHLPDPAGALDSLRQLVRPAGLVAFLELTMSVFRSMPSVPLVEKSRSWVIDALLAAGVDPYAGDNLAAMFRGADLPVDGMATASPAFVDPAQAADLPAATVRGLAPVLIAHGMITAEELDTDTLESRLREQLTTSRATVFMPQLVGAWSRLPA